MERVKKEKSQYARSLIEASLDPLFTISIEGKITDLNKASSDIIGNTRERIIGTDFFGYFTDPLQAREVYMDVYRNGFVTNFPLTIKEGKQTDILFNGTVYKDSKGNVVGAVVVTRDITEQKSSSAKLTESIAFAESVAAIAEQAKIKAETATQIAESAVKAKQQLLSNMSHKIRTPMNAIIGFTRILLKTDLTTKQKEYLSAIKISGDALIVIVNDILDLSKKEAGEMKLYENEEDLLEAAPEIQNIKVLVVEDILLNQLLLNTLLGEFGFQREIAENGKVAIEMLKNSKYDIILMDLHMPVMNGFEATEYIRNEMKSKIPIIALTADVATVDLAKCKLVGINDYLAKPVDDRLLHSKIVSLLKNPGLDKSVTGPENLLAEVNKSSSINLDDLIKRTKSNPVVVMEMIKAYLDQTPPLIIALNKSFNDQDWKTLYSVIHKMIPSFTIMGISKDFENMAKEVQEDARSSQHSNKISDHVLQLSSVCTQACMDLKAEFDRIKKSGL